MKMTGYSHGLEKIYAFETINPQTVRRAGGPEKQSAKAPEAMATTHVVLTFNFGPEFQEAIPNLRLKEPLASLALTPFALKGLLNRNIKSVEEALQLLQSDPSFYKGLGQGHIEEISQKIESFLGKYPHEYVPYVDWESLVRCVTVDLEAKERYVLLKRYDLEESSIDIQPQEIQKLYQKSKEAVKSVHGDFLQKSLSLIAEAFLRPFLRRNFGFATHTELTERLQKVSKDPAPFKKILSFLQDFSTPLPHLKMEADGLYVADVETLAELEAVIKQAKSYFYQPFVSYPLSKLTRYLVRDFAKFGSSIDELYIQRLFDSSSQFLIRQDSSVSLNWRQNLGHRNSPYIG